MPYRNFDPSPPLQDYLKCFWYAERELQPPNYSFDILPDSFIELVFCFGEQPVFFLKGGRKERLPHVFILGLLNEPFTIESKGWIHALGARFYPWGFAELIQLPINEPVLQLQGEFDVVGVQLKELITKNQIEDAIRLLESLVLKELLKTSARNHDTRVTRLAKKIYQEKGTSAINTMAREFYLSERQLNRVFSKKMGTTAKALSRKIRFQHARDAIFEDPNVNLTSLAYDFDYSDQSHFINDFKEFTGKTPGAFASEMKTLKESLSTYNVRFLQ